MEIRVISSLSLLLSGAEDTEVSEDSEAGQRNQWPVREAGHGEHAESGGRR